MTDLRRRLASLVFCLLIIGGCGQKIVHNVVELSAEQNERQEQLLQELYPFSDLKGAAVSDYRELISLADQSWSNGNKLKYQFDFVGTNDDGSESSLLIYVVDELLVEVHYAPITR